MQPSTVTAFRPGAPATPSLAAQPTAAESQLPPAGGRAIDMPASPASAQESDLEAGGLGNRQVIAGLAPPDHRVTTRRQLAWTSPLTALVAGAGLYGWASRAYAPAQGEGEVYAAHLRNVAAGAAGLVGGAALPPLIAWARYALGLRREEALLRTAPYQAAESQLDRLVEQARAQAPLTEQGLRTLIHKMYLLADGARAEIPPAALALAMARLATLKPVGGSLLGCSGGAYEPMDLVAHHIAGLKRADRIEVRELKEALLSVADHRAGSDPLDAQGAKQVALALFHPFLDTARYDGAVTWEDLADFMVLLRELPCMQSQRGLLTQEARDILGCDHLRYQQMLPQYPVREVPGFGRERASRAAATGQVRGTSPLTRFLALQPPADSLGTPQLDALVVDWAAHPDGAVSQQELAAVNRLLAEARAGRPDDLRFVQACQRTHFLLNHWTAAEPLAHARQASAASPEPVESSAAKAAEAVARELAGRAVQDESIWNSAPCGVIEALAHLADLSRADPGLQALAGRLSQPGHVTAILRRTPITGLRAEVGMALDIARHKRWSVSETSRYLLSIARTLTARQDLPSGAFLGGLLPATAVETLVQGFIPSPQASDEGWALTLASLPQLCQLQATPDLVRLTARRLRELLQPVAGTAPEVCLQRGRLLDRARDHLLTTVNERLVPARFLMEQGSSLALPWLDREFRARIRG